MSKINIYVNPKNRKSDESPSNFSVIIPDGFLNVIVMNFLHYPLIHFIVTTIFTKVILILINSTSYSEIIQTQFTAQTNLI